MPGHADKKTLHGNRINFDTYIMFDRVPSFLMKNTKPNNWVEDSMDNHKIIRRYFTYEEDAIFTDEQMLELASKELAQWVRSLNPIGYLYSSVDIKEVADDRIV